MELLDYEIRHIDMLKKVTSECTLFLNRSNNLPLKKPGNIVLVGNGVRHTIKGGTGSGDVNSRYFKNIDEAFREAGFINLATSWLDSYESIKKDARKAFIKDVKKRAYKVWTLPLIFQMGCVQEEPEYNLPLDYDTDTAIYVLSRDSGEGNDRRVIKGDVLLSDTEIRDILYLDSHYKNFCLILNVGGVIDITPIKSVSNILLLSQLGTLTSEEAVNIILGKSNPSGKLTTSWAPIDSYYKKEHSFGDIQETKYSEGIYVGYRYLDSFNKEVNYPFGYGLSYTDFSITPIKIEKNNEIISVYVNVKNIGKVAGKEVVQIYISEPTGKCASAYQVLAGFKKTKLLEPSFEEIVKVDINMRYISSYCTHHNEEVIRSGEYIVRVGNSSRNTKASFVINVDEKIILKKVNSKFESMLSESEKEELNSLKADIKYSDDLSNLNRIELVQNDFKIKECLYDYKYKINDEVKKLSNEELSLICTGQHGMGAGAVIGESSKHVPGAAGETTRSVGALKNCLVMSDGPAGIRVLTEYGKDSKGVNNISMDKMMISFCEYLPKFVKKIIDPSKNRYKRNGEIIYQYTTAIPIGTALAQSYSEEVLYTCGDIIGREMEIFDIDLWLAPALNIHRNILCGRNFEYYSEDPLVSGLIASYITKGVEAHKNKKVTIKHFCANNQELNRNNNNSLVSEKSLRQIYMKGFEICINESNPGSIMTSYNLLNYIHTSESYELLTDVLRSEWGYKGLVMSDWIQTGRTFILKSKYKAPRASLNIKAGNDLTMPGVNVDCKDILKALKKGILKREELELSASRIFDYVESFK